MNEGLTDRLRERMKQVRVRSLEGIIRNNTQVKSHLDLALPDLEKSLNSRPDLLRVVTELYNYIESEAETLSEVVVHLREAKNISNEIETAATMAVTDVAGSETMIMAKQVYEQIEVDTIVDLFNRFELPALQDALEKLEQRRFIEIAGAFEDANRHRKGKKNA